jgi:hypothetical protein
MAAALTAIGVCSATAVVAAIQYVGMVPGVIILVGYTLVILWVLK